MRRAPLLATAAILLAGCGSADDAPTGEPIEIENAVVGETPAGADAADSGVCGGAHAHAPSESVAITV